jgi:hypothetical protein
MSFLLFPGRHLVNTKFQKQYLKRVMAGPPASLPGFLAGVAPLSKPPTEIVFAITSANQENSRFNPIPFHIRAVGVDRFARQLQAGIKFRYRVFGIPHYGHTKNFAAFMIKEIALQSEQAIQLTPENCLVLCSTPEAIKLYQELVPKIQYRVPHRRVGGVLLWVLGAGHPCGQGAQFGCQKGKSQRQRFGELHIRDLDF